MEDRKLPTMVDVARRAGVSQTTVSLVLNGKAPDSIPESTRQKIWEASADIGYSINKLASALNGRSSGIIGVIADSIVSAAFGGEVIKGAQDTAMDNGKMLMLAVLDEDEDGLEQVVDMFLGYRVEAIIYATSYYHEIFLPETIGEIPVILVNCFQKGQKYMCIVPDDYAGAYQAARYLLESGHRDILYLSNDKKDISGEDRIPATLLREQGIADAFREYAIEHEDSRIRPIAIEGDVIYEKVSQILSSPDRPTAILCYNDRMALSVYSAAAAMGIRIPEELSVVGFDDQPVIVDFLFPRLTTVALPHYTMGQKAIECLWHNTVDKSQTIRIKPKLVIRESVKVR